MGNIPKKINALQEKEDKLIAVIEDTSKKIAKIEKILAAHKEKVIPMAQQIESEIKSNQTKIIELEKLSSKP